MALWWIEGFEAYGGTNGSTPTLTSRYSDAAAPTARTIEEGRIQGKCLRILGGTDSNRVLGTDTNTTFANSTGDDEVILGFAFKPSTLFSNAIVGIGQNNTTLAFSVSLHLVNTGAVAVGIAGSIVDTSVSTPIVADEWHYIEFKVLVSDTGSYEVKVDGSTVLSGSADTLIASTLATAFSFYGAGSGNEYFIDDLYLLDTTGTVNNDFLGDQVVLTRFPTSNGDTIACVPLSGDNWENVDDNPHDSATSYVTATSDEDIYNFADIADLSDVAGIGIHATINRSSGTTNNVTGRQRSGGTTYSVGTARSFGSGYVTRVWPSQQNPDTSSAWDVSSVNAAQFGFTTSGATLLVTQVYIAVLGTYSPPPQIYDVDAESVITVTQQARNAWYVGTAEHVVSITSEAEGGKYIEVDAESAVTVAHEALASVSHEAIAASTVTITQDASANTVRSVEAESAVTVAHTASETLSRAVEATTEIVRYDTILDPETLEEIIVESGIGSVAGVSISVQAVGESELEISQLAYEAGDSTTSAVNVTQDASAVLFNAIAESQVEITSTASANVYRNISATSTVTVTQATSYTLPATHTECFFSPFIGESGNPDAPDPPPAALPAAAEVTGFRLQYPATGAVTDELIFKNPSLGNTHRMSFDRINLESRGGTLIIFADPIWPKIETLLLSFSALTREKAHALKTFMRAHLGEEIRLIDHEHRAWIGVITNPQDPIVEDRRGSFTASFDFEGSRDV